MSEDGIDEIISINDEEKKQFLKEIKNTKLPSNILSFVEEYEEKIGRRDRFLWKWGLDLVGSVEDGFMLSTVNKRKRDIVRDLKVIFTIFVTAADDLADIDGDREIIRVLEQVVHNQSYQKFKGNDSRTDLDFMKKVWNNTYEGLEDLPRFDEFSEVFIFDLEKLFDSFWYSCLIGEKPSILNLTESWAYDNHNMLFFLYTDIDLMASPNFDIRELGPFRNVVWKTQEMARIGNWISTWKREVKDNNLNSGVIAKALEEGVIEYNDLENQNSEKIIRNINNSDIIDYFLNRWEKKYEEITQYEDHLDSVNIKSYIKGVKKTMKFHLLSEGLK